LSIAFQPMFKHLTLERWVGLLQLLLSYERFERKLTKFQS